LRQAVRLLEAWQNFVPEPVGIALLKLLQLKCSLAIVWAGRLIE